MKVLKRALFTLLFFLTVGIAKSQQDSCNLNISLLTCGPGAELYSLFGHSAFRVTDSSRGMDVVFNYGTMDFDDPAFLAKFTIGEMTYYLSVSSFQDFLNDYRQSQRDVIEQKLSLSCVDKLALFQALRENASEQNKYYNYEFLFNNCSSKLRDMLVNYTGNKVHFGTILPDESITFRNMIHEYLNKGRQCWSKFGIDILLGANLDKTISSEQAMFLPDYLMKGYDSAILDQKSDTSSVENRLKQKGNLVDVKRDLYRANLPAIPEPLLTPTLVFSCYLIVLFALSLIKNSLIQRLLFFTDVIHFFVVGALGLLLVYLWVARQDTVCRNNFNLLWAIPIHVIIIFFLNKPRKWVRSYLWGTIGIGALLLLSWKWLPQNMNNALIPIVLILMVRSFFILKKHTTNGKKAHL